VKGDNNLVLHGEWDDLNKILTIVTGSNMVNSAAGIMFQERRVGTSSMSERTIPKLQRKRKEVCKLLHQLGSNLSPYTIAQVQSFQKVRYWRPTWKRRWIHSTSQRYPYLVSLQVRFLLTWWEFWSKT
jgi:hypothetical protein